jgi:hypothetical protein
VGNFDHIAFTTGLTITDSTTPGAPHTFSFGGLLNGMLRPGKDTLTSTFTTPTTQTYQLGTNIYTVTINDIALPGIGTPGAVTYNIGVSAVPEPSTLVLSGLGATSLAWFTWRRRRARHCQPAYPASDWHAHYAR